MQVPGIETRPIRKITGEYGFTQTFFTDARIPADCLMGEEGQGWKIAMQTLQYERGAEAGAAGGQSMVRVTVDDMVSQLAGVKRDGEPVLKDPVVRDQLVQAIMEEKALSLGDRRAHIPHLTSDYPGSLPLSHKLRATEMTRRMRQLAINLQGAEGALYVGDTRRARAASGSAHISTASPPRSAAAPARCRPTSSRNISSACRSRE